MKRLSVLLLLLCIFITGCNNADLNSTPIDNTTMYSSDSIDDKIIGISKTSL